MAHSGWFANNPECLIFRLSVEGLLALQLRVVKAHYVYASLVLLDNGAGLMQRVGSGPSTALDAAASCVEQGPRSKHFWL
jgi:hypothetical protein